MCIRIPTYVMGWWLIQYYIYIYIMYHIALYVYVYIYIQHPNLQTTPADHGMMLPACNVVVEPKLLSREAHAARPFEPELAWFIKKVSGSLKRNLETQNWTCNMANCSTIILRLYEVLLKSTLPSTTKDCTSQALKTISQVFQSICNSKCFRVFESLKNGFWLSHPSTTYWPGAAQIISIILHSSWECKLNPTNFSFEQFSSQQFLAPKKHKKTIRHICRKDFPKSCHQ